MENKKRNLLIFSLVLVSVLATFNFVQAEDVMSDSECENLKVRKHNFSEDREKCDKNFTIKFSKENREDAKQALNNGDYNAWLETVGTDSKMAEYINEDNFAKFVEMHNLNSSGDHDAAKVIAEELGINFGHRGMKIGKREKSLKKSFKGLKNKS